MNGWEKRELKGYEFVLQSGQPIFAGNVLSNNDVLTTECILGRFSNFFQKVFQNSMGLDPSSLITWGSH